MLRNQRHPFLLFPPPSAPLGQWSILRIPLFNRTWKVKLGQPASHSVKISPAPQTLDLWRNCEDTSVQGFCSLHLISISHIILNSAHKAPCGHLVQHLFCWIRPSVRCQTSSTLLFHWGPDPKEYLQCYSNRKGKEFLSSKDYYFASAIAFFSQSTQPFSES